MQLIHDTHYETQFVDAASDFCLLIEQIDDSSLGTWLESMGQVLQRMEYLMIQLSDQPKETQHILGLSEMETRFELYVHLKNILGDLDEYWSEDDLRVGDGQRTGSLSEDLAEIYFEIIHGMMIYDPLEEYRLKAMLVWISGYRSHWRQHLLDARKQLIDFFSHRKLRSNQLN